MVAGIFVFYIFTLVTLIMISGLLWCTFKSGFDSVYFTALKTSCMCAVSAFIFTFVRNNEFEILKSLLLTANQSVIVGVIWFGIINLIFKILIESDLMGVSSKLKLNLKEVWLFGVLPSIVFLGYVVSQYSRVPQHSVSFWWLKGLLVVVSGLMLLLVGRLIGIKVIESAEQKRTITVVTSPLLWIPLVLIVFLLSFKLWFR